MQRISIVFLNLSNKHSNNDTPITLSFESFLPKMIQYLSIFPIIFFIGYHHNPSTTIRHPRNGNHSIN